MKNQKGVSLIALIITIIVIIILAAIVMQSSTGTIDEANFSGFAQEIGDYTSSVTTSAASIKADAAVEGFIINDAQKNYMLANGISATDIVTDAAASGEVMGKIVPAGQEMTETILRALGYVSGDDVTYFQTRVAAYEIEDDKYVEGYRDTRFSFYGDSNGKETHFVTSDGTVFTLPGFPRTQEDKSVRYFITPTAYYTVTGQNTTLTADMTKKIEAKPIQAADLAAFEAVTSY